MMSKRSYFATTPLLLLVLAAGGCGGSGFPTFGPNSGNGGGNLGGGPGGGTGGGSSTASVVFAPDQVNGIGQVLLAGDASRVVFADDSDTLGTNVGDDWQVWGLNLASADVTQLTSGDSAAFAAATRIDTTDNGGQVVYVTSADLLGTNPNGRPNVFLSATDGTISTQVTDLNGPSDGIREAIISGDGSVIAISSDSNLTGANPAFDTHIFTMDADGSNLTQVSTLRAVPTNIAFSDDGSKIVFHGVGDPLGTNPSTNEIFVMDVDGSNLMQLTSSDSDSFTPLISDDGSLVVFTSRGDLAPGGNADGSFEIFVARTDGGGITQISNSPADSGGGISRPNFSISGNGAYVAFTSTADFTGDNPNLDTTVFWAPSSGGAVSQSLRPGTIPDGVVNLTAVEPSLNNDGSTISFQSSTNFTAQTQPGNEKIYTIPRQ